MGNPFGNIPWGSIQGNQQQEDPQQGFLQMILAALLSGGPPPQQPLQVQTPVHPAMGAPPQLQGGFPKGPAPEDQKTPPELSEEAKRFFEQRFMQQMQQGAAGPQFPMGPDLGQQGGAGQAIMDHMGLGAVPSRGENPLLDVLEGAGRGFVQAGDFVNDLRTMDRGDIGKAPLQVGAEQVAGLALTPFSPGSWAPALEDAVGPATKVVEDVGRYLVSPITEEAYAGGVKGPESVYRWTDPNQVTEDFTAPSGERTFDQDVAAILSGAQTPTQAQELAPSEAGKQTVREVGSQGLAEDYAREQQKVSPEPDALAGSTDEAGETAFINREIQLAQQEAEEYPEYKEGEALPSRDEADAAIEDAIKAIAAGGPEAPEGERLWETILRALLQGIMGAAAGNNWWQAVVGAGLYSGMGFLKKTQAWRAAREQYKKDKDAYATESAVDIAKLREAKWQGQRVVWDWAEERRKERLASKERGAVFREGRRATEATEALEADRTKAIREGTRTRAATTLAGQKITARGQAADIEYRKKLTEMSEVESRLNNRLKATQIAVLERQGRQTGQTPAYSLGDQQTIQNMGQKGGPEYLKHVRTQVEMYRNREDAMLYVAEGMADRLAAVFGTEDAKGVEEEIQALVDKETGLDEKGRRALALRLRTLRIYAAFMGNDGHAFLERAASGAAGVAGDPVARWVLEFALHSKWFERVR